MHIRHLFPGWQLAPTVKWLNRGTKNAIVLNSGLSPGRDIQYSLRFLCRVERWRKPGLRGSKHRLLSGLAINLPHLEKHSGIRVGIPPHPAAWGASGGRTGWLCQTCWCFSGVKDKGALKLRWLFQNYIWQLHLRGSGRVSTCIYIGAW